MAAYKLSLALQRNLIGPIIYTQEALHVAKTRGEEAAILEAQQNMDKLLSITGAHAARKAIMDMY